MLKAVCKGSGRDSHPQRESYESDTLPLDHLHLQRHMGSNNLLRVATQQCAGRESNLRPFDHKSNALTTTLPSHPQFEKFDNQRVLFQTKYASYWSSTVAENRHDSKRSV